MANKEPECIHVIIPQAEWADWFAKQVLDAYVPQEVRKRIVVVRPDETPSEQKVSALDEVLTEMLKDPVFRKAWEESETEYRREFGVRRAHHDI
ncbi:MAG: hypothetical protein ACUVTZ_07490 [Armatimonadota bacterium]